MADFPSNYRTMIVKDAVYPKAGNLLNYDATSGAGTLDLTAADDAAFFVALDESSRDADQTLVAAGATITACPIGGMLNCLAIAGEVWVAGQVLYVEASGLASKTATGTPSKVLGHFLGSSTTTVADTLYQVNTKQSN